MKPRRAMAHSLAAPMWFTAAIVMALAVRVFVVAPWYVPSPSMEPTIPTNTIVVADRFSTPERGDIVVFEDGNGWTPERWTLAKRVLGIGGDHLTARGGVLTVNGVEVAEPYAQGVLADFEAVVPPGALFMVGDNRTYSSDSRCHFDAPFVDADDVVGVVRLVGFEVPERTELHEVPDNPLTESPRISGGC